MALRRFYLTAAVAGGCLAGLRAAEPELAPAGGFKHHHAAPAAPAAPLPTYCPPGAPAPYPGAPSAMPGAPSVMPGTPGAPATPGEAAPGTPATPDAATPQVPTSAPAPATPPGGDAGLLAQGTQGGGSGGRTALPTVFGDLPGAGGIAGPLPVVRTATGQFVGAAPTIIMNGQRMPAGPSALPPTPFVDESLAIRTPANTATPGQLAGAQPSGFLPPPGATLAPELLEFVAIVPQVVRGAFKITENESPRPTTRAYFTYNFYDQVFKGFGGPDVPRIVLHQQTFGYEQAFADEQFSLGIRLPYNQLVSPGFVNFTGLGDLTLIGKATLLENLDTGDLISGGLALTVPSGSSPFPSSITGQDIRGTLLQPFLGYIYSGGGDLFVQGFSSIVVPTNTDDATFLSNDMAIGYRLYSNPGAAISSVIPVVEFHLNTPLDHRGANTQPVGFVDQFTILGGLHTVLYDATSIGFAAGAPITGPRPFSLQATFQLNYRF